MVKEFGRVGSEVGKSEEKMFAIHQVCLAGIPHLLKKRGVGGRAGMINLWTK